MTESKNQKSLVFGLITAFFIIPSIWFLLDHMGFLRAFENFVLDIQYFVRGEIKVESKDLISENLEGQNIDQSFKLAYVNVDQRAIKLMGNLPIPVGFYSETAEALFKYGMAKTIGITIPLNEVTYSKLVDNSRLTQEEENFRLQIAKMPNLVLSANYANYSSVKNNPQAIFEFPLIYRGFSDYDKNLPPSIPSDKLIGENRNVNIGLLNADSFIDKPAFPHWVPVFSKTKSQVFYTMALELHRLYFNTQKEAVRIYDGLSEGIKDGRLIVIGMNGKIILDIPMKKNQLVEINWFNRWNSEKDLQVSLADVMIMKKDIETGSPREKERAQAFFSQFENSVVLMGYTDPSLDSFIYTPIDANAVPSVSLQGNLLKTFVSGYFITRLEGLASLIIIFVLNAIAAASIFYSEKLQAWSKFIFSIFLAYIAIAFLAFGIINPASNIVLPLVAPFGSVLTIILIGGTYQWIIERKQKVRIKKIFGTYLSPELVRNMVESEEQPQLGGVEKEITAFFSDIQNFSAFAELLTPGQIVELMNEYLTVMTDILREEGGTLDKFIGDAIVAMFGAPLSLEQHAWKACMATCRMQQTQDMLIEKWKNEDSKWPREVLRMRTRIGLNSGLATVGNMGSSSRFNYTMMGDTVNLAARCESGAKAYGVYSVVSEDTYFATIRENNEIVFRFLDRIVVKGRSKPVGIYEIIGIRKQLPDFIFEGIELFGKGIQAYLGQNWESAINFFERSSLLEQFRPGRNLGVSINPSLVFVKRCKYMKLEPPGNDWDGTFVMKTK